MVQGAQNKFGFPTRNQHVSDAACAALIKAAGNVEQLSTTVITIDRVSQTPIVSRPANPPASLEPMAACLRFYEQTANSGTAEQIVKLATISRTFRERFPRAVAIAKLQLEKRSQKAEPQVLNPA